MVHQPSTLDRAFHALADPTRRRIVNRLARGDCSVSELARPFAISLPGVRKHLQVLEAAGLISCEKRGRVRRCHLESRALRPAAAWLERREKLWDRRLQALDAHLQAQP